MNRFKKLLTTALLCIAATVCCLGITKINYSKAYAEDAILSGNCGTNLSYSLDSNYVLTVSGTGAMTDYASYNNVPWYSSYRTKIIKVVINNGVTSIGDNAFFGCSTLTEVTIPNSVTSIGITAFATCSALTEVTIPDSVKTIGMNAFQMCSGLEKVTIGSGIENIGNNAFNNCKALKEVTIKNKDVTISSSAFKSCGALKTANVPCNWNNSYTFATTVTLTKNHSFGDNNVCGNCGFSEEELVGVIEFGTCGENVKWRIVNNSTAQATEYVLVVSGTGAMTDYASYNNVPWYSAYGTKITKIVINEGVTTVGDYAFFGCKAATEITIPNSVTIIGNYAFNGCFALTEITIPNSVTAIGNNALYYCYGLTEVTIPNSVTSIGAYAFQGCTKLEKVTIGTGVESMGDRVFFECSALTEITIPKSVKTVGEFAFYCCTKLEKVTIENKDTFIGSSAFLGCSVLTTVALPCNWNNSYTFADTTTLDYKHTETAASAVAPTCTKSGSTEGKACSGCGMALEGMTEIPALGHTDAIDKAVDPTCTESGLTEGKHCSVCSEVLTAQTEIPALGHTDAIDKAVDPTCTESGLTEGKHCSVCSEVLTAQTEIPALGHNYESTVTEPNCQGKGYTTYTCICGYIYVDNYVENGSCAASLSASLFAPILTGFALFAITKKRHNDK